jgi:hypothetical protein
MLRSESGSRHEIWDVVIHYVERTWWPPVVRARLLETIAIPAKPSSGPEVLK